MTLSKHTPENAEMHSFGGVLTLPPSTITKTSQNPRTLQDFNFDYYEESQKCPVLLHILIL
jgi:hypothetical protein